MVQLLLLLACSGGDPSDGASTGDPVDGGSSDGGSVDGGDADGGAGDGGSGDGGTGDGGSSDGGSGDGGSTVDPCPSGMVPVPPDSPDYCIDAYEGEVVDGMVVSEAGRQPTVGITFDESVLACEATPVLDASGAVVGYKRLATLTEWEDSVDGVVGEGGTDFPYGSDWVDGLCATMNLDNTCDHTATYTTGSFPECVSAFGVYDALGNVWEWADPGLTLDVAGWLLDRSAEGREVRVDSANVLSTDEGVEAELVVLMAGLVGAEVERDATGALVVSATRLQAGTDFAYRGYLKPSDGAGDDLLPVQLDPVMVESGGEKVPFMLRPDEDGAAIPAKVGCAWYTGSGGACAADQYTLEHTRDFDGTIGLRCASDPIR